MTTAVEPTKNNAWYLLVQQRLSEHEHKAVDLAQWITSGYREYHDSWDHIANDLFRRTGCVITGNTARAWADCPSVTAKPIPR